jgi:hypothetical protein
MTCATVARCPPRVEAHAEEISVRLEALRTLRRHGIHIPDRVRLNLLFRSSPGHDIRGRSFDSHNPFGPCLINPLLFPE